MSLVIGPIQLTDKEKNSERTAPQILVSSIFDSRLSPNNYPLTYDCIRKLRKDPTVQLARWAVLAPMIHTPWVYESTNKLGTQEMFDAVEQSLAPLRDFLLQQAVFGTCDFGWQPFEVVYKPEGGQVIISNFKALLQDYTDILVYLNNGGFAGFVNEPLATGVNNSHIIPEEYSLCTNFSVEGTDWYGYSVFQSLKPVIESWDTVENTASRYDRKVAGASWIIYYPVGKTPYNGVLTDNAEIAKQQLSRLEASGGAVIPDEIQEWLDDTIDREAKGKWRIELMSANTSTQSSFVDRQKYLDALKMRAFGLTERSVLEGSHGTKAEADVHGNVSLAIVHSKHKLICNQITTGPVYNFMRYNFGEKYEKAVCVRPAPLVDTQFATVKDIYRLIMQTPETLYEEVENIDIKAMRTELGIPTAATPQLIVEDEDPVETETETELEPVSNG